MKVEREAVQRAFIPIIIRLETPEEAIAVKALAAQVQFPTWHQVDAHRGKAEKAAKWLNEGLGSVGVSVSKNEA